MIVLATKNLTWLELFNNKSKLSQTRHQFDLIDDDDGVISQCDTIRPLPSSPCSSPSPIPFKSQHRYFQPSKEMNRHATKNKQKTQISTKTKSTKSKTTAKKVKAVKSNSTRHFQSSFKPTFIVADKSTSPSANIAQNNRKFTTPPTLSSIHRSKPHHHHSSSLHPHPTSTHTIHTNHQTWFSTSTKKSKMSQLLAGKKIIITGASSGIGEAAVIDAINEGATVVAIGRNEEKLKALQETTKCHYLVGDLTSPEQCKQMVDKAAELMGGLTTLVNCAGVLKGGAVGTVGLDNFQFNFMNNTQSVWSMMEHAIPHLKLNIEEDGASIVNISSVNGQQSFGGVAAYCAAKAAVDMLSKCSAVDLAPFKIRVNSICPGVVATNLQKTGGLNEDAYATFIERSKTVTHPLAIPRGEVAQPQDVANLITFLASDKAKWITGDNIKIDGGRACMGAR